MAGLFSEVKSGVRKCCRSACVLISLLCAVILLLMESNCWKRFQNSPEWAEFMNSYQQAGGDALSAADRLRVRVDDAMESADGAAATKQTQTQTTGQSQHQQQPGGARDSPSRHNHTKLAAQQDDVHRLIGGKRASGPLSQISMSGASAPSALPLGLSQQLARLPESSLVHSLRQPSRLRNGAAGAAGAGAASQLGSLARGVSSGADSPAAAPNEALVLRGTMSTNGWVGGVSVSNARDASNPRASPPLVSPIVSPRNPGGPHVSVSLESPSVAARALLSSPKHVSPKSVLADVG